jgi:hypothetical protein
MTLLRVSLSKMRPSAPNSALDFFRTHGPPDIARRVINTPFEPSSLEFNGIL